MKLHTPAAVNPEELCHSLAERLDQAVDVRFLPVVASTSGLLGDELKQGQLERSTLLFTDEQAAGRGTRGRTWLMQPTRDIALTLAVPYCAQVHADARLSLALGAAVALALERVTGLRLGLKWPNDLLAGGSGAWRKCGGLLLETLVAPGAGERWLFAGLGLNVNSQRAQFPPELAGRLTTVRDELGGPGDREALLTAAAVALAGVLLPQLAPRLAASTPVELLSAWRDRDQTAGSRYMLRRNDAEVLVWAVRVDGENGELVCRDAAGTEYTVASYTELDDV